MTERWEILDISSKGDYVFIFTPKSAQRLLFSEYLQSKEDISSEPSDFGELLSSKAIMNILAEGWEPFSSGSSGLSYVFRRKVNSRDVD